MRTRPSIGVGKSRLTGQFAPLGMSKGDAVPLMVSGERTNPLFISPGHKVDIETALAITQRCFTCYRLPEPTRLADKLSKLK